MTTSGFTLDVTDNTSSESGGTGTVTLKIIFSSIYFRILTQTENINGIGSNC